MAVLREEVEVVRTSILIRDAVAAWIIKDLATKMTQREISRRIGVTPVHLTNVKNRKSNLSDALMLVLCDLWNEIDQKPSEKPKRK